MAGKNYAFKVKAKELSDDAKPETITLDNVYSLSLYQIRQELTRREVFDDVFGAEGEKRKISFESCLEVLVAELVREKEANDQQLHAQREEEKRGEQGESLEEQLKRKKEERKRQALERSRQRQAEADYFAKKKQGNAEQATSTADDQGTAAEHEE